MKKRIYSMMAAILLAAPVLLTACGNNQKPEVQQSVTIFAPTFGTDLRKLYDLAKEKFEEKHHGVTVNLVMRSLVKAEDFVNQMHELSSTDQSPDIVLISGSILNQLAKQGELRDLTPMAKMNAVNLEDYFDSGLLANLRVDSKQFAIPTNSTPLIVMYNKTIFKDAGIAEPQTDWTWDDFADIARKLHSVMPDQKKPFATVFPLATIFLSALSISNGGTFLSPDGSTFQGYLDSKMSVQAIEWYAKLANDQVIYSRYIQNTPQQVSSGTVGMYVAGFNELSLIPAEGKGNIGVAVLPAFSDRTNGIYGLIGGMAILEKSRNPQLAWEFIHFLTMEKNEVTEQAATTYVMDISKKVIPGMDKDPFLKVKLDSLPYLKRDLAEVNPNYVGMQMQLQDGLQQIVQYSSDFQKDLTALAVSMDAELKKVTPTEWEAALHLFRQMELWEWAPKSWALSEGVSEAMALTNDMNL